MATKWQLCVGGCGWPGTLLCDAPVTDDGKTCDAAICRNCAKREPRNPGFAGFICVRGPGGRNLANDTYDLCPAHREVSRIIAGLAPL